MLDWPAKQQSYEDSFTFYTRIFRWAIAHFVYDTDQDVWGVPEHWDSLEDLEKLAEVHGKVIGDCDDFAQLCRHALAKLGIPSRIVICTVENSGNARQNHAVAESPEGWVLDNRQPSVTSWPALIALGYKKDCFGPLTIASMPMDHSITWFTEKERE